MVPSENHHDTQKQIQGALGLMKHAISNVPCYMVHSGMHRPQILKACYHTDGQHQEGVMGLQGRSRDVVRDNDKRMLCH
jgi:hypothetical protein